MGKINTVHKDRFNVWDGDGKFITGLVKADFGIELHNQDRTEVSSTIPVGITEMESGLYESDFNPPTEGIYSLKLTNDDYLPTSILAIYEVDDSSFDTIEDKIDIIDGNVDSILEDTSGLEANLTGYISGKTNDISGYISDHDLNMDSNFDTLTGLINTSESNLSGVINDSDQQISGYIISSENNVSGYIIDSEIDISGYIVYSESNIRGADNDDLKVISDQISELDLGDITSDIANIKTDINTLESEMSRALGLMQENQKIVTLTKSITGKMLTGIKYLYTDNTMLVEIAVYDITVTYDTNDQAVLFLSVKR